MEGGKMNNPRIIFFGTPEFGAIVLEGLIKADIRPVLVVTAPDKPVGRKQALTPPPVKVIAQKYGLDFIQIGKTKNHLEEIKKYNPDLIISAAFGQIFPKELLEIPKKGGLNVHPSLLPRYRGSSPIQQAILNGDKETGVAIILMDEELDHGPIVAMSKPVLIKEHMYFEELSEKLAKTGAELLTEAIPKWLNNEITPKPQDDSKMTYAKILEKEDGRINWNKTAQEIERQVRALSDWPSSFTFWEKSGRLIQVKILKAKSSESSPHSVGQVFLNQNKLAIQCRKDSLIIEELQLEGSIKTTAKEFLNGHRDFINQILK
jgi:methionyl-tRNA formyltransferase